MDVYDKSYEILKKIASAQAGSGFRIVLIGGWAAYLYNPHMKSRDIDLAVGGDGFWKLRSFLLGEGFSETSGGHLGKKGFSVLYGEDRIDVDVYDEKIGEFPVSRVLERAKARTIDSVRIQVADETTLLALKVICASDRMGTAKGGKDIADIIALLDARLEKLDFSLLEEYAGAARTRNVARSIFSNYQTAVRFYPLAMEKFRRIKGALKRKGLF